MLVGFDYHAQHDAKFAVKIEYVTGTPSSVPSAGGPYYRLRIGPDGFICIYASAEMLRQFATKITATLDGIEPPPPTKRADGTYEHLPADADAVSPEVQQ